MKNYNFRFQIYSLIVDYLNVSMTIDLIVLPDFQKKIIILIIKIFFNEKH